MPSDRELFRGDFRAVRQQTAVFFTDTHYTYIHTYIHIIYIRTQTLNPPLCIGAPGNESLITIKMFRITDTYSFIDPYLWRSHKYGSWHLCLWFSHYSEDVCLLCSCMSCLPADGSGADSLHLGNHLVLALVTHSIWLVKKQSFLAV